MDEDEPPPTYDPSWNLEGEPASTPGHADLPPPSYDSVISATNGHSRGSGIPGQYSDAIVEPTTLVSPAGRGSDAVSIELLPRRSSMVHIREDNAVRARGRMAPLPFMCNECIEDPEAFADPAFFGDVITTDGSNMPASRFKAKEIGIGPVTAAWRLQKRRWARIVSGFMHVAFLLCVGLYLGMFMDGHPAQKGLLVFSAIICYAFVFGELLCSPTATYVRRVRSEATIQRFVHRLRHARPYLFVKLTKYKTEYSRKGLTNNNAVSYEREVEIRLNKWEDLSSEFDITGDASNIDMYKLKFRTAVCFMDRETYGLYENTVADLNLQAEQYPGHRTELKTYFKLLNYEKKITVSVSSCPEACPCWFPLLYWVSGICLIGWIFRVWFKARSSTKYHYTVVKCVGI